MIADWFQTTLVRNEGQNGLESWTPVLRVSQHASDPKERAHAGLARCQS